MRPSTAADSMTILYASVLLALVIVGMYAGFHSPRVPQATTHEVPVR